MPSSSDVRQNHRRFLNKVYGPTRSFYDLTRKFFLFGRERALQQLVQEPWERLIEVGPGTGRNLRKLHKARPSALLGGLEACDKMLEYAQSRCPYATLQQGFAEEADYVSMLEEPPDRILFSYSLSMMQDPAAALTNAQKQLAPGGTILVVDFADFEAAPTLLRTPLQQWLKLFHVTPLSNDLLSSYTSQISYGFWHYYVLANIPAQPHL